MNEIRKVDPLALTNKKAIKFKILSGSRDRLSQVARE